MIITKCGRLRVQDKFSISVNSSSNALSILYEVMIEFPGCEILQSRYCLFKVEAEELFI